MTERSRERETARQRFPVGDEVQEQLDELARAWGLERSQLGATALAVGLGVLRGYRLALAGPLPDSVGTVGGHSRASAGHGTPCIARARTASRLAAGSSAAAEPAPDSESVPADLTPDELALVDEAVEWRMTEIARERGVRSPLSLRKKLRAEFMANTEEADAVLDRKVAAGARPPEDDPS